MAFNADYDAMESVAESLNEGQSEINEMLSELRGKVDELLQDGFTTEQASQAFGDAYTEMSEALSAATEQITEMSRLLTQQMAAIQDLDGSMAG